MSEVGAPFETDAVIDNDMALKAACYGVTDKIWPPPQRLGVLGTARFVLPSRISKGRIRNRAAAAAALSDLLRRASVLEPSDEEEVIAVDLEIAAQEAGLPLDAGESQLAAIAMVRSIAHFDTGDKRAIRALERLAEAAGRLARLEHRVRSLEQLVFRAIASRRRCHSVGVAICAEPDVDKALSICFGCFGAPCSCEAARGALRSYIEALRRDAPRVLAPG